MSRVIFDKIQEVTCLRNDHFRIDEFNKDENVKHKCYHYV